MTNLLTSKSEFEPGYGSFNPGRNIVLKMKNLLSECCPNNIEAMSFPTKDERKKCWDARDKYWTCLDGTAEEKEQCLELRKLYENSCPAQWVKHFDRKRTYLQFKDRIEKEGYVRVDENYMKN